jgi:Xaa-Pro aminopeptidase
MGGINLMQFSPQEYERRYRLTGVWLEKAGLDALLLYANSYGNGGIRWLTNFAARHDTYLLWPRLGTPLLLTQLFNHVPNAQRVAVIDDVRWGGPDTASTLLALMRERQLDQGVIGLAGRVPYADYTTLVEGLAGVTWRSAGKGFMELRLQKSDEELAWLRQGAAYTDAAMAALVDAAQIGASEHALAAAIEAAYSRAGGEHGIHFLCAMPMEKPHAYVPAQTQTDRRLSSGDVVISELSAGVGGYSGQIHRPLSIGASPTPHYRHIYEVALEAYERIVAVLRPGATVRQVLDAADIIEKKGLTVCDDLLHGYGMGYLAPVLRTRQTAHSGQAPPDFEFRERMAIVVQPNVYDPASGAGLQVGGLLMITDSGAESLQRYPMGFFQCGN